MQRTLWTDRNFNFDYPVGLFPNICERLRGTAARLNVMTSGLTEKEAGQKQGNKWSIKEQIGHLANLEALHEGRINDFLLRKESLRPADMSNAATRNADHNTASLTDLLNNFSAKRTVFVSRLEQLSDEIHEVKSLHPRLKVLMRPIDMAYFTAEHDDHHLTSIRELMKNH